jgi:hypothetical protein
MLRFARTEVRLAEVRPAEVRHAEVRPAEVRHAEVRHAEVRPAQAWTGGRLFGSPRVPNLDALPEEIEMLWIGHCVALPQPTSRRH